MSKDKAVTEGSGNVFADLGMPDAAGELVKAQLKIYVGEIPATVRCEFMGEVCCKR